MCLREDIEFRFKRHYKILFRPQGALFSELNKTNRVRRRRLPARGFGHAEKLRCRRHGGRSSRVMRLQRRSLCPKTLRSVMRWGKPVRLYTVRGTRWGFRCTNSPPSCIGLAFRSAKRRSVAACGSIRNGSRMLPAHNRAANGRRFFKI